ncbi:MAG: transposase [Promethearchaeota archaeon]
MEQYEVPKVEESESPEIFAIDQGLINLAACVTTKGNQFLYTGKALLSIQRYFNKQIAKVQHQIQARKKKFAWNLGLTELYQKRTAQIMQALHALTKEIIAYCHLHKIPLIVSGKLKKIRTGKNWGKKGNQKLHA